MYKAKSEQKKTTSSRSSSEVRRLTAFLSVSALTDQVAVRSVGTSEQGYMS